MSTREGTTGTGARHYGDELAVLKGRLASEPHAVRPDDKCLLCEREGRLQADENCWHRHWETTDEPLGRTETR